MIVSYTPNWSVTYDRKLRLQIFIVQVTECIEKIKKSLAQRGKIKVHELLGRMGKCSIWFIISQLLYFIDYWAHTSIVRTWISQWFLAKILFYFSSIILQELIITSLFDIKIILNPFAGTFHVKCAGNISASFSV